MVRTKTLGLLLLTCGCGYKLPPKEVLQQGCHVWYSHNNSRRGVSAEVRSDGVAVIQAGREELLARLLDNGDITLEGEVVGKIEGERVVIGDEQPFEPELYVDLGGDAPFLLVRWFKGAEPYVHIERSAACSLRETALGAAPVVLETRDAMPQSGGY